MVILGGLVALGQGTSTLIAATGATLRELVDRMGHSTTRAALIYLHGSDARQHEIADALNELTKQRMTDPARRTDSRKRGKPSGTQRHDVARKPHEDRDCGYPAGL